MTESAQEVTVPRDALVAFVHYANAVRMTADSQFNCSRADDEASKQEFDDLVTALGAEL